MRKNELRRNLIYTLITVAVAAISLATATYSWFSTQSSVEVANVDFTAEGSYGMDIAVPQNNDQLLNGFHKDLIYKGVITADDAKIYLDNTVGIDGTQRQLQPVSTVNTENFFILKTFDGNQRKASHFRNVNAAYPTSLKPYLALPVYIMSNDDCDVYLRQWETTVGLNTVLNGTVIKGIGNSAGLGAEIDKALRIAFVPCDTVGGNIVKDYINTIIYEPNPNPGSITNNSTLYFESAGDSIKNSGIKSIDADGAINAIELQNKFTDKLLLNTDSSNIIESSSPLLNGKQKVFSTVGGVPKLVYIYAWLEGNDYECLSYITYGTLNINLSFIAAN